MRTIHWWKAALGDKLKGWQIRIIVPREGLDALTLQGTISELDFEPGPMRNTFVIVIYAPVIAISETGDPYHWTWIEKQDALKVILTESDLDNLEKTPGTLGGVSYLLPEQYMTVMFIPPGSPIFLNR